MTPLASTSRPVVDVHCHLYDDLSPVGVDPERLSGPGRCDVLVDAGSYGPETFAGFAAAAARTTDSGGPRVLGLVNVARRGLEEIPEIRHPSDFRPEQAVATALAHPQVAVGLKVRATQASFAAVGPDLVARTCVAAAEAGLPVVVHTGEQTEAGGAGLPTVELLDVLRAGDVVTHVYTGRPGGVLHDVRSRAAAERARARGVLFDVGHGAFNFDVAVARAALADGFPPDLVGSDVTRRTAGVLDVPAVLAAVVAAGLPVAAALLAATDTAMEWLSRRPTLSLPSAAGVLTCFPEETRRTDSTGADYRAPVAFRWSESREVRT